MWLGLASKILIVIDKVICSLSGDVNVWSVKRPRSGGVLGARDPNSLNIRSIVMKKFVVVCDFGGQTAPFSVYIGDPKPENHPLQNQANWLSKERGGVVPADVMDSLSKLRDLARQHNVSFEELCVYALGAAAEEQDKQLKN